MNRKHITLRATLNIYSVLLIILPLGIVVIFALTLARQQVTASSINQMQSLGEVKVQEIRRWLGNSETTLSLILTNPEQYRRMQDMLLSRGNAGPRRVNVQQFLSEQLALQTAFSELFFYNEQGTVRLSTDFAQVGRSIADQPYFTLDFDGTLIQPPYFDPHRNQMTSLIQQPIYHPSGYVLGVMAGRLNLDTLAEIMGNRAGLGETGETYLVSQVERSLITPSRFEPYNVTETYQSRGIDLALTSEQSGAGLYDNYRNQPVIGVYLWLPEIRAVLLAEIETAEAFSALNRIQFINAIVLIIAVSIAVTFSIIFTNRLVRPIKQLTKVATAVMQGDYERRSQVNSVAEIVQLAHAFDTMTDQLVKSLSERDTKIREVEELTASLEQRVTQQTEGLRTVAQLSEELNAILNINDLMAAVVNQVQKAFGYYHAHIYLLNEEGNTLLMMEGTGPVGTELKRRNHHIALSHPNSLVALAAREQRVVLVDDVRQSPDWLPNELLPETQAEIAVPILREEKAIGVLDVQSNEVAGLDLGDDFVLRSLANQVGVAINNARLYEDLAKVNTDKDKFFSIVAHDLKGPFMPLLGNTELLAEMGDAMPPDKIKEMGESLHRSAQQTFTLLETLLSWARIQMGRMPFQPQPLDLATVAARTVSLLQDAARNKSINLSSQLPAGLTVEADENMVDTIIRNLTNNALKFTSEGGRVTITADQAAAFVEVSVADTGIGMSAEDQAKLFKIDVHHSTAGTGKESGTGLGLIMCQEMVQQHGGQIWVESELGVGTTVNFTLPSRDGNSTDG